MRTPIARLASRTFLPLILLGGLNSAATAEHAAAAGDGPGNCLVHWQRKAFEPGQWPAELPAEAQALISRWRGWAQEFGYRMDFDEDVRVMTLSSAAFNRSVRKEEKLVKETLEAFDQLLPVPRFVQTRSDAGLRESREEEPVVLLRLHDRADYLTLLEFLSTRYPQLQSWAEDAQTGNGFMLDEPLCAAWIEKGVDRDGWRPANEMVHRLASTLCQSRFGTVPHWMERAVAWELEFEVQNSIHCFPHRSADAPRDQEKAWKKQLKDLWSERTTSELALEDLSLWEPDTFDETFAGMSWGLVRFLKEYRSGTLSSVLHDLGTYGDQQAQGPRSQSGRPHTPAAVTETVLRRYTGTATLAKVTEYFKLGSRFVSSR